ncbi:hypothetical protein CVT25_010423 [Psilocybe cyanescens]|uniref:AB hydrolase-1 domain-containing protein n=1 Tax=Psilocybe cyanescens TaxID=93625 RepID=A0A409XNZ4_PSICY|nr:hypothetical protein CVT25_010423 [Psilocybe cyanescens]
MNVESFAFDAPFSLKMAAKRYSPASGQDYCGGLTLMFMHCIGSHKEQWEPVIEQLFKVQRNKDVRLREAWAFDWQSHGDSAVLNREALKNRAEGVSVYEWAGAIAEFVKSPRMKGHRIIPLGHSAGAAVSILLTKTIPPQAFSSVVLIEPTLSTRESFESHLEDRMAAIDFAVAATSTRRDHWLSREQAFGYFKKRIPWEVWDDRVIRLMTDHALEDSPSGGVNLKWDRKQEAISYADIEPHFEGALQLGRVCHSVPIHVIWGTRNDLVPEFIQDSLSDVSEGRVVASVTKVKNAGHMASCSYLSTPAQLLTRLFPKVVQEQPDLLARAIASILEGLANISRPKL